MSGEGKGLEPPGCPIEALATVMALDPRDWSVNPRDAWIYGIFLGWGDTLGKVAEAHGWDDETRARLERLHGRAMSMRQEASDA